MPYSPRGEGSTRAPGHRRNSEAAAILALLAQGGFGGMGAERTTTDPEELDPTAQMLARYNRYPHAPTEQPVESDYGSTVVDENGSWLQNALSGIQGLGAGIQKKTPNKIEAGIAGGAQTSGMDPLYRRLVQQLNNVPQIDYDALINQNQAAITAAYQPQIQGLRQQNKATGREFKHNRGMVQGLAKQAQHSFNQGGEKAQRQGDREVQNIQDQVAQEAAGINTGETQQARQIGGMLRGMGQEQAAPGAVEQILKSGEKAETSVRGEGAVERRIAKTSGAQQEKFLHNMAAGARLMGNDAVADLAAQKADILAANRAGIAGLKKERGTELANVATTLSVQEAQDQLAAEETAYGHFFDLLGYKEGRREFDLSRGDDIAMAQAQMIADQNDPAESFFPDTYSNAQGLIQEAFNNPTKQGLAANLLNAYTMSDAEQRGEYDAGGEDNYQKVTPGYIGQWLVDQANKKYKGQFTPEQLNILRQVGRVYGNAQ